MSQTAHGGLDVTGVPYPMRFLVNAAGCSYDGSHLVLSAGEQTDCFSDPSGIGDRFDAPMLVCPVEGDFQLTALVRVAFADVFDAGTLVAFADDANWAKVCFELSVDRQPRVVSVVTHGRSDDANGYPIEGDCVVMRITRRGGAMAFHAAHDNGGFELVRHFHLAEDSALLQVGFGVQSPRGKGCRATFESISLLEHSVVDLRNG